MASSLFLLVLPSNYRVADFLSFHGRDPDSPAERVVGQTLRKGAWANGRPVEVRFDFEARQGEVAVHAEAQSWAVLDGQVRSMLALDCDPGPFERAHRSHPQLGPVLQLRPGLRVPQLATVFESLVWAVLGQQVNLAFAFRLRQRVIRLAGAEVGGGLFAHPSAEALARLEPEAFDGLQLSRSKAACLIALGRAVVEGRLPVETLPEMPRAEAAERLLAINGIGPWTAQYVLLRGCGDPDALPVGDSALHTAAQRVFGLSARPTGPELTALMEPFRPHRALAAYHLWASLKPVTG